MEADFQHRLKKRRQRKCKSNLSLNQSRNKKKKFNYGQQVKVKKIVDELGNTTAELPINEVSTASISFQIDIDSTHEAVQLLAASGTNIDGSENDSEDVDVGSQFLEVDDITPYVWKCINTCKNSLLENVIKRFEQEGLLFHFMAFIEMISSGQLSVINMAVLLVMEMAVLFTLTNTTQMHYRNDTSLFWETVLAVGGQQTLRLFSSDKYFRQVHSGQAEKSKYCPNTGNFNFAVPDEKTLHKLKTGLPTFIQCGIINESVELLDKDKEFVLSMDVKQLIPGLVNESEGDVNLWGYEGPPTLNENLQRLEQHKDIILDIVSKASIEENAIDEFSRDLKLIVQLVTKCIWDLRQAKVCHEQLWSRFNKKISNNPEIGSRYEVAFSDIECFIRRADAAIKNMLDINLEWCYIMSLINSNSHCFRRRGPVLLDTLDNSWILRDPEILLVDDYLKQNPQFMKQRSDLWLEFHKVFQLSGSTIYSALGLRTLKDQMLHYRKYINKEDNVNVPTPAMQHRTNHEVCITVKVYLHFIETLHKLPLSFK